MTAVLAGAIAAIAATAPVAVAAPAAATPIRHLVVLMQADHSFDNYFGTFPGADGIPRGTCQPIAVTRERGCVRPFHLGDRQIPALDHPLPVFRRQHHGGRMDGFVAAYRQVGAGLHRSAMGFQDGRELPYAWAVARRYVLFDRFFASAFAGTLANRMYWVAGRSGTDDRDAVPPRGFTMPTIFDRLQARGIPWRVYVENYDPGITYRDPGDGPRRSQPRTVPLLSFERFLTDRRRFSNIVDLEQYFDDVRDGRLPAVSYIVTSASSERTPGNIASGQQRARALLEALIRTDAWRSAAFLWTYDGWGGWYDHVPPPRVDRFGYGFRVPALLASPYARRGHVDHTTLDFTSVLRFIEDNWRLRPLARRDARARSIASGLDFRRPPHPAQLVAGRDLEAPARPPGGSIVVLLLYGGAVILTAAVLRKALRSGKETAA
jgi:phospholipase C